MERPNHPIEKINLEDPIAKEKLDSYKRGHYLTLGDLHKRCEGLLSRLPSDTIVLVERVEDWYYEGGGWPQFMTPHEFYGDCEECRKSLHPAWSLGSTVDGEYPVIYLHY